MYRYMICCLIVILTGCASTSKIKEKEWINDYIDNGQLSVTEVAKGGISFLGSKNKTYSNITHNEVTQLNNELLRYLYSKYKKENVTVQNSSEHNNKYLASYLITNNVVTKDSYKNDDNECFKTNRELEIEFHIEHTMSEEKIWGGKIAKKLSKENCVSRSKIESDNIPGIIVESLVDTVVETAFDGVFGTYPEPPNVSEVASKIFYGFYENMP